MKFKYRIVQTSEFDFVVEYLPNFGLFSFLFDWKELTNFYSKEDAEKYIKQKKEQQEKYPKYFYYNE